MLSGGGATRRYERRSDPAAKLGRAVRRFKGTAWLERPPRVEVASAMFGERILVGIAADLRGERLLAEGAAGSLGVVGTAAAATLGLLASPWFLLVAPAALVAGGGIAVFRRASVAAAQRELDAFVAAALAPPPPAVAGPLGKLTRGSARSSTGRRSTAR